jgi:hypothetical protein
MIVNFNDDPGLAGVAQHPVVLIFTNVRIVGEHFSPLFRSNIAQGTVRKTR